MAEKYEKLRLGYVPGLYNIFNYTPINQNSNVVEVGIRGSQATSTILKTGCNLTAVEYGTNLAELCRNKIVSAFHWIPEKVGYRKVFAL